MSDYLVKETLDFFKNILALTIAAKDKRPQGFGTINLVYGMAFLSPAVLNAAIGVIRTVDVSTQEREQALVQLIGVIRREVGAVAIDEDGVRRLYASAFDLLKGDGDGDTDKS